MGGMTRGRKTYKGGDVVGKGLNSHRKENHMRQEEKYAAIRRTLMRWGSAKRNAKNMDKQVEGLKELIEAVTDISPQVITGMPHGTTVGDPTAAKAERLMRTKEQCLDSITEILDKIGEEASFMAYIDDVLEEFPAAQKRVIELKYITYGADTRPPWVRIGIKMDKTDKAVRRLEERAIARMARYIDVKDSSICDSKE